MAVDLMILHRARQTHRLGFPTVAKSDVAPYDQFSGSGHSRNLSKRIAVLLRTSYVRFVTTAGGIAVSQVRDLNERKSGDDRRRSSLMRHVDGGRRSFGDAGCRLDGKEES